MRASSNGPMGALLMIAPLAVIIIFAVVGIPQFAPVVASPVNEVDLGEEAVSATTGTASATPDPEPAVGLQNLFAPHTDGSSAGSAVVVGPSAGRRQVPQNARSGQLVSAALPDDAPAYIPNRQVAGQAQPQKSWSPPPGALDGWEVADNTLSQAGGSLDHNIVSDGVVNDGQQFERTSPADGTGLFQVADDAATPQPEQPAATQAGRSLAQSSPHNKQSRPRRGITPLIPDDETPGGAPGEPDADVPDGPDVEHPAATEPDAGGAAEEPDSGPAGRSRATREEFGASNPQATENGAPADIPSENGDGAEGLTWSGAVQRLKELGIQKYRLESVGEGRFLFHCTVHPANNPRVPRYFQAEAGDLLEAVQKVLDQIDEWRSR